MAQKAAGGNPGGQTQKGGRANRAAARPAAKAAADAGAATRRANRITEPLCTDRVVTAVFIVPKDQAKTVKFIVIDDDIHPGVLPPGAAPYGQHLQLPTMP